MWIKLILYFLGVKGFHLVKRPVKVVLRCTGVVKLLRLRLMQTSKTGISWFSSSSSVNFILGCLVLRKCRKLAAVASVSNNENLSSTYLNQMEGRESTFVNHFCSKSHMKMLANNGPSGDPIATHQFGRNNNRQIQSGFSWLQNSSKALRTCRGKRRRVRKRV